MDIRVIIANTLPRSDGLKFGVAGLQELQSDVREQVLSYQGRLYRIESSEIIRMAVERPTVDEYALVVELRPVEESVCVDVKCDHCSRTTSVLPEDVTILGVNLKGVLENSAILQALIKLMNAQSRDLRLESLLRTRGHENCTGREKHHDAVLP